jgi:hypothetical protein
MGLAEEGGCRTAGSRCLHDPANGVGSELVRTTKHASLRLAGGTRTLSHNTCSRKCSCLEPNVHSERLGTLGRDGWVEKKNCGRRKKSESKRPPLAPPQRPQDAAQCRCRALPGALWQRATNVVMPRINGRNWEGIGMVLTGISTSTARSMSHRDIV